MNVHEKYFFNENYFSRFHIFCSHYLCEEDIHSFDPKINNENLTKCLQTLKQIYTDLYSEQVCLKINF